VASCTVSIGRAAALIPGVYKYCDDWCSRCRVTSRCLSYRIRQESGSGAAAGESLEDLVEFTRRLAAAAGETTDALDATIAGDPKGEYQPLPSDEWLIRLTDQYVVASHHFLRNTGWTAPPTGEPSLSPSPLDIVAWYSMHMACRASRAIVAIARAERGFPGEMDDALGCAKIAHVGIAHSLAAYKLLGQRRHSREVPSLEAMLRTIATGLETRVPGGRDFVRLGLDVPVT
jgi:hypothetical protein